MKVNEIFYSLQGEGRHTGCPALFLRLSGCNLKCDFCDTEHQKGVEMQDEEIIAILKQHSSKCKFVVITGGEPSLQLTKDLIEKLHNEDYYVAVETNGTKELPSNVDWITLSPKYKDPIITKCDEIKIVYEGQNIAKYDNIERQYQYIQPCDRKDAKKNVQNLEICINYIKDNPTWKLSLQTQKILNVQ